MDIKLAPPRQSPGAGPAAAPSAGMVPRRKRRRSVIVAGVGVSVVGALIAWQAAVSEGHRETVLAVAQSVQVGQTITASDLTQAQVSHDQALDPVPVSDSARIIGKVAQVGLVKGELVTSGMVSSSSPVTRGKSVVPVQAKPGQLPAGLVPGDRVQLVSTGTGTTTGVSTKAAGAGQTIDAVVVSAGATDPTNGTLVSLAVDPSDGPTAGSWAQSGAFTVIQTSGSGS